MMLARAYLETPARRFARWTGSASMIAVLHVTAGVFAFLFWPGNPPETQHPGAIMIELEVQAGEASPNQQEIAEQPVSEASAPPPSPAETTEETPPEEAAAEPQPVKPAPDQTAEAPAEPLSEAKPEETPPVEEAPLAPEPEVTLPKEAKEKPPEKPVEETQPKKAEPVKKPKEKAEKSRETKAQKSESKQRQQAASAARGRFDPNPVYRPSPVYPAGARAKKVQGRVVVSYTVLPSGAVSNVRVVSASPPGVFNAAAVAAVRQWRFKPSAQGGKRSQPISFRLR